MRSKHETVQHHSDRPLRTMFLITSMPVGGAETLLVNLVRNMDRSQCHPEIACLKEPGELGRQIAAEVPVHSDLIRHKFDVSVVGRLRRLLIERRISAVVTVGAGDKMFWGRLAARLAGVPVILSALHSTGWPDGIGRLNRLLTSITDGFIAVARNHARHLIEGERFPADKVFVIPNGIDTKTFRFDPEGRRQVRSSLGIAPAAPVVGIVASLRPEKNHSLFLRVAAKIHQWNPEARFLIVGDGPERNALEQLAASLGLKRAVHFLGNRADICQILSAVDLFALTSLNEANPVSILEAMACRRPVVAPDVGSINESVRTGQTGWLLADHEVSTGAAAWKSILADPRRAEALGIAGRAHVEKSASLSAMVHGYQQLITGIYDAKRGVGERSRRSLPPITIDPLPAGEVPTESAV